jgi:hypothetical protein
MRVTTEDDFYDDAPAKVGSAGVYGLDEKAGKYKYPSPPGIVLPKGWRGWMRMTNLAGAFSDQKALQEWLEWKAFMGLRTADGLLFDEWMAEHVEALEPRDQRELAVKYGERARQAAHADQAARRGTARHKMMDTYLTTGYETGTRSMRAQLASAVQALDECGLEVLDSEFRIWHPLAGGVMGTSDVKVSCRHTGQTGILDWKTQARFYTWQNTAGQLYGYDSAPWIWRGPDTDEGFWERQLPNTLLGHPDGELAGQRVALVAHMPQAPGPGQLPVEIHEVSMEYGKDVLVTAARNVELRSIGRSTAVGRRPAGIRPRAGVAPSAIAG